MRLGLIAVLTTLMAVPVVSDEGMWTFDNFPADLVKSRYGISIDQGWLDHVRQSAVRLSGCSASVVSAEGLVLTNHHCVVSCVQALSTPTRDYMKEGFFAGRQADEQKCPTEQGEILETISDVTSRVASATKGTTGERFVGARNAAIALLETDACTGREATHRCQVITLYQGGEYKLYTYRRYSDVRLVVAPEQQIAFFGGDPDNFNFPRYDLDFSFLRLYDNGKPAATPTHLSWSIAPPTDEVVFVVGNPGTTNRLQIEAQLASRRDVILRDLLLQWSELRGRYIRFAQEDAEHARIVATDLFGLENALKANRGQQLALMDPAVLEAKRRVDAELKQKVSSDARLADEIGDPWAEIARAQGEMAALYPAFSLLELRAGFRSDLFFYGRQLVRAAEERGKSNTDRLPEYSDARLPLTERNLLDPQPVYPDLEQLKLEFWLSKLREYLTADAEETKAVLGRESPENLARALASSKLGDPAVRQELWAGGPAAIKASQDPMIQFMLRMDPVARAARRAYEERVQGPESRATERIARARFAVYGTNVYPDATSSLRLSFGRIAGWEERGREIPAFTQLAGLYERATGHPPYDLPARWAAAKGNLDLKTVFNISSTNDVVGGNSGSPLLNARREVIGVLFDGNIWSLGGSFHYDSTLNRSISVSTAAITEALRRVYGQEALVRELTSRSTR
jgi:hypothetical protein